MYLRDRKSFGSAVAHLGLAALAVTFVGCGPSSAEGEEGDGPLVGVVFDSGGLGDRSFNDSANRGLERAADELGVRTEFIVSGSESDYESNLTSLADEGAELVVAVGLNMATALQQVAPNYPDTKFAIVDAVVEGDNVRSLLFREEEGSFLVGYLAGLMTETDKVGFVGGEERDLIKKFQFGFAAGARMANPSVEILPAKYTGSWNNVDLAREAANVLYDDGADIVYHAAGRAGLGVIEAASARELYAIGVDSDQDDIAEGRVLTSMIKRVDSAVFATIGDLVNGEFESGSKTYALADDGVGISELRFTRDAIGEERLARLDEVRQMVVAGDVVVPTDEASYDAFAAGL